MYIIPIRFRGNFIVTTRAGKTIATGCAVESVEWLVSKGRDRTLWRWSEGRYIAA